MSTATVDGLALRLAGPEDSAARCALFAQVSMDADLVLSIRRDPDFDALYRLQSDDWECWIGGSDGDLTGMGTFLFRDGYLLGEPARIGYLGDLRMRPGPGRMRTIVDIYGPLLEAAAERRGCDVFLSAVIATNDRALRALASSRARAHGLPPYTLLHRFSIRAIHLALPRRRRRFRFDVEHATDGDIPELASFLDADARARPFGYALGEAQLRRRLRTWPGLDVSSFLLARDRSGRLVGCIAVWNATAVKRTVVEAYRGSMRRVRLFHDAAATALRSQRLPAPGAELRYSYVTHQAIPSEDPEIMRALLDRAYAEHRRSGLNLLSVCVLEDDPLAPAYAGYRVTDLAANLYAVTPPGGSLPEGALAPGRPGFEMALV